MATEIGAEEAEEVGVEHLLRYRTVPYRRQSCGSEIYFPIGTGTDPDPILQFIYHSDSNPTYLFNYQFMFFFIENLF